MQEELLELLRGVLGALWSRARAAPAVGMLLLCLAPEQLLQAMSSVGWFGQLERLRSLLLCPPRPCLQRQWSALLCRCVSADAGVSAVAVLPQLPCPSLPCPSPSCLPCLPAGVRLGQMSLQRGESARHKILLIEGLAPGECRPLYVPVVYLLCQMMVRRGSCT